MPLTLRYEVIVAEPLAHLIEVHATVESTEPFAGPLTLFMPVWTPGSYLVREFARHIEGFSGPGRRIRKNAWQIDAAGARSVTVRYRLYCNELSVRTNHVDETHALLNGASTFLALEGHLDAPCCVRLRPLPGWRIATALEGGADSTYRAADYDTLADSPIVMGQLDEVVFDVLGRPHQLTIWPEGRVADRDVAKLVVDIKAVVRALAGLFDGTLPYERYAFLLHMSARGRGGLEHGDCATLLANPHAFATRAGYLDLLSLIAHETLHAWNVKRIRPEGLTPYRYQEENYTRLLWWFEGATSYFDWLTVRHARLCTVDEYLDHLATEIVQLEATPGRLVQSLEDSSFEAWIKLYRPDENSANSGVSYYRKGEVVCALLDLELRARTQERVSLQSVLAYLWKAHGAKGLPVPERGMQEIFERVSGVPMGDRFDAWIRTPGPLDVRDSFYRVGLRFERQGEAADGSKQGVKASLGLKVRTDAGRTFVSSVVRGGAGQKGGVDTGDELIAVDGRRIEPGAIDQAMWGCEPGRDVELLVSHEGRIALRRVTLDEARAERAKLVVRPDATPAERARFAAWLGDEHPAWATKRS